MIFSRTKNSDELTFDDGQISLDLRLAVTGHRTLPNPDEVEKAVNSALDIIMELLPPAARAASQMVAISALADGADRLVAKCVLMRPNGRLEVILPMAEAEYLEDFSSTDSVQEFEHLLAAASWVATVSQMPTRNDSYEAAGRAIVDRADITIAIWDGRDAGGKGGTAEIVRYVREYRRPLIWISAAGGEPVVENLARLTETGWLAGLTAGELSHLVEFNATPVGTDQQRAPLSASIEQAFANAGSLNAANGLSNLLNWIQPPLARAESLSRRFQLLYLRLSAALFALAAAAVCIASLQLVYFPHVRLVTVGEIACLLTIVGGLEWGRRRRVQQRWISARYLAERLRNAFFLALAGTEERPSAAASIFSEEPAAAWVRTAFRMVWIRRPEWNSDLVSVVVLRRFLAEAWIEDQINYFSRASRRNRRKHRIYARVVEGLFGASVVVAITHVALSGSESWFHHLLSWLSISIPTCAAALAANSAQREYLHHAQRYDRVTDLLAEARIRMLACTNRIHLRAAASLVDRLLREEHSDWFGTIRLHDLEIPA